MRLTRQTILITGGSSGIGRELARQLVKLGNDVIVTGRDQARLTATARDIPGTEAVQSDLADSAAIERLYHTVIARFPACNMLINNAGIMRKIDVLHSRALHDMTREIEVGLTGPIQMTQQFLPHLLAQREAAIVNVTSGLAFVPMPLSPVYSAAKAGLHSFTRSLRAQLAGSSVSVFEVAPPGVETPLFRAEFAEEMKDQTAMPVETLARHVIAGIEAGRPDIRPGLAQVLYAMSRLAPGLMLAQMAKLGPRRSFG